MSTAREILDQVDALRTEAKLYEAITEAVCHTTHPWALVWADRRSVDIPEAVLDELVTEVGQMALDFHTQAAALEARVRVVEP